LSNAPRQWTPTQRRLKKSKKRWKDSAELKKEGEKTVKLVKHGERSVYEEMRERETRRLNVVFYGIAELNEREATGKDKMAWDRKKLLQHL
jgi:hypothetical protein